ncbi:phosphatase PAP2 family protein [Bifidobacterium sp. SMB2]|uniref:Phosphatase PAP2 family protein n=1 Tax=Bifidobacterium saimiriisciurei TaxID=2661627 RepID=A0ABX0CAH0_9BIFI|nr:MULTISPECIES: phosphatase PAP2 family protein [Bifidobacterium]NEG97096.1 phosphatase PAP2 family protein [Bifidobacterium sp. SMB2]NEH12128.1 phosphatase PAP2 family protein [Bifidobacterium saimiriisciurei]
MSDKKRTKLYLEPLDGDAVPKQPTDAGSPVAPADATPAGATPSGAAMPPSFEPLRASSSDMGASTGLDAVSDAAPVDIADGADGRASSKTGSFDDPLLARPHTGSLMLCIVLGIVALASAFIVWWVAVQSMGGQEYDNLAYDGFSGALPGWMAGIAGVLAKSFSLGGLSISVAAVIDVVLGIVAVAVGAARRRWRALVQMAVFAVVAFALAELLKHMLPRPVLNLSSLNDAGNTSPSGHAAMAAVAAIALLCVVPRALRALVAVLGALYTAFVGLSVVAGGWHRPTDIIVAMFLVGGLALLALAFTRTSGMDEPGTRVSSASVQIAGTVMIVGGLMAGAYGLYLVWQLAPGLQYSAKWAAGAARISGAVLVFAVVSLMFGLTLAMRHITAAPLSKAGLVGAPPAPPKRR